MKVIVEADGGSAVTPGPGRFRLRGVVGRPRDAARRTWAGHRRDHQQRRRVPRSDRRVGAGPTGSARRQVAVRMDSKLVVEQMSGRWKVKHAGMAELHQQARSLASTFESVSFHLDPA